MMRSFREKWHSLLVVVLLATFAGQSAKGDTYNFFFKDKPKKGKKQNGQGQPDVIVSDGDETHSTEKSKPVNPLTAPANGEEDSDASLEKQNTPIIINNTNNIAVPSPHVAENESSDVQSDVRLMAGPPLEKNTPKPSSWRFGAGVNFMKEQNSGFGATVSMATVNERGVALNFYAGIRDKKMRHYLAKDSSLHIGTDLEVMMMRSRETASGRPVFEAGPLIGASTISAHRDNLVSIHTGLRMNFNLKDIVGVSVLGRVNLGYFMTEAAITTRL